MKLQAIALIVLVITWVEASRDLSELERQPTIRKNFNNVASYRATNERWRYWSDRVIPYTISSKYTREEKKLILASMKDWSDNTCLTFRPKRRNDKDYLHYDYSAGDGCGTSLGKVGGKEVVYLEAPGCMSISTIMHEIGHAIGLVHEHQHPYRDTGIRIVEKNVKSSGKMWFEHIDKKTLDFFGVDYDMDSLMHYSSYAFSRADGKRTMETRDPSLQFRLDNYHKLLSFSDVLIINRMLKCSTFCKRKVSCPKDGYVNAQCKCVTPEAFYERRCKNSGGDEYCMKQASLGQCKHSMEVVEKCTKMCDLCPMYKVPRRKLTGGCENLHQDDSECKRWKKEGKCDDLSKKRFLATKCAKTCNLCGIKPECIDDYAECKDYPLKYCKKSDDAYQYMMDHCRTRCGLC